MSAVSRESLLSCLANELKDRKGQFTLNRQFSQAKKKSIDPKVEVEQAMQLFNNTCEITQNVNSCVSGFLFKYRKYYFQAKQHYKLLNCNDQLFKNTKTPQVWEGEGGLCGWLSYNS